MEAETETEAETEAETELARSKWTHIKKCIPSLSQCVFTSYGYVVAMCTSYICKCTLLPRDTKLSSPQFLQNGNLQPTSAW